MQGNRFAVLENYWGKENETQSPKGVLEKQENLARKLKCGDIVMYYTSFEEEEDDLKDTLVQKTGYLITGHYQKENQGKDSSDYNTRGNAMFAPILYDLEYQGYYTRFVFKHNNIWWLVPSYRSMEGTSSKEKDDYVVDSIQYNVSVMNREKAKTVIPWMMKHKGEWLSEYY